MSRRPPVDPTLPKAKLSHLWPVLAYLKPYRLWVVAACVALLFTSTAVLSMGAGLRYLIDNGIAAGDTQLLDNAWRVLLGVVLMLAVATFARYYFVSKVGEHVVEDLRNDVYRNLLKLDIAWFETNRTGEILSRITTDTTLIQNVVGSSVSIFLRNALMLTGGTVMLIITSWNLTQYVGLMLPLVIVPIIILGKRVRLLSRETQDKVADISVQSEETIGAIRTIQAMSLEQLQAERFAKTAGDARCTAVRRIRARSWLTALVISLVFGAIVTVLWVGGRDVIAGNITPGDLSAFIFYAVVVAGALGALSDVVGELQRAAGATERLMELMHVRPSIVVAETPEVLDTPVRGQLQFDHVCFRYPSRPQQAAMDQVSFEVQPGESVALVGPSGAGKSTVYQLLLRFYDPASGTIRIDGHDLTMLNPPQFRSHIGMVPQDPVIFSADVWYNIRCGAPEASDEAVRKAAQQAAALEFIERLPQGFDSYLGEKGVRLSGGQRQRIAIARALVRNPEILLLDEATSALDSANEQLVQQALEEAMRGRTTLIIAHRLSTVRNVDRILVFNEGRIEASGTHEQLLKSSPLYKELAQLQLSAA
jgi:ATP-binding cassette subfamily B protein